MKLISLAETGWLPDGLIRHGIRRLLKKRLKQLSLQSFDLDAFVTTLKDSPLALATDAVNSQHYEIPPEFFEQVLGPRLKYSCCFFASPEAMLGEAEESMLRLTCERAQIESGQRILELGCGWGSLSLWMAERYPRSAITAVSNSASQRRYIQGCARDRGFTNLQVITADMRDFAPDGHYDRIVSVEMFEHMRNYELLFRRVANWLAPGGQAFVHVFCHVDAPYLFETDGPDDWMGRNFFTGGTMPSLNLFEQFGDDLQIAGQWEIEGMHYWRTCEQWLHNLDRSRDSLLGLMQRDLTERQARVALQRWRIFFMACAELFRFRGGAQWLIAHYRFEPVREASPKEGIAGRTSSCSTA